MIDETDIDDGGRPDAVVDEGNELEHSRLSVRPLQRMRNTMVLVSSSLGEIYKDNGRNGLNSNCVRNHERPYLCIMGSVCFVCFVLRWVGCCRP